MKTIAKLGLALALIVGFVASATAGDETTVTGKIMCAKCTLKKADAKECQDVLVVKDGDKTAEYYVEKNDVAKAFGHAVRGREAGGGDGQGDGEGRQEVDLRHQDGRAEEELVPRALERPGARPGSGAGRSRHEFSKASGKAGPPGPVPGMRDYEALTRP